MSASTAGTAAGATAAAAIAQAIKASGTIVKLDVNDFHTILRRQDEPLIIVAQGGFLKKTHRYLTSYKGLAFYTQSPAPISLPGRSEVIAAQKIWMP